VKNPKKWYDELTDKGKKVVAGVLLTLLTGSGGGGVYAGMDINRRVDVIEARLNKRDLRERIDFLERQVSKCKARFGNDFLGATDPTDKDDCLRWKRELRERYKEIDSYYKG
jgi:hypothetical protein